MHRYGLIGFPLSHSFSKSWFEDKFAREGMKDLQYDLYPIHDIHQLSQLINSDPHLIGLNVTIPYKEKVIPLLDQIDPAALQVGAVNVIRIERTGNRALLSGYNTDIVGFEQAMKPYLVQGTEALILGTGGAAKASAYVFRQYGIRFYFVSRNPAGNQMMSYEQIRERNLKNVKILVNATPLGMFPDTGICPPLPYEKLSSSCIAYDWIYNPEQTLFLLKAGEAGAMTINGAETFRLQAQRSWQIWNSSSDSKF